ncbi:hypothetical protein TRFO_12632 [Tritrichomonas foetus]|uniref:L-type lectin-like domain-containing protein n=1 Tax=Tritrichomonas foetus TaxID=1144522 RepID=A0A1J4L548_9EUKA|nr:hypothetical protein TRFO_12632 [Tritrichomonas foetus]|eukprot:OHT17116.1 hypothetical protein TRFO_12632 [Tritrichomonas foetus]
MFSFLLLYFILSKTESNQNEIRRFISRNPNFSGDWEYGGDAKISNIPQINLGLFLTNEQKTSSGYSWLTQRLPSEQWHAEIKLNFTLNYHSSKIGIWMTKDFGANGTIFGGPVTFHGVGLLFQYNGTSIVFEVRENDGHNDYLPEDFYPTFEVPFLLSSEIILYLNFSAPFLKIDAKINDENLTIFHERPRVKVRRHWFSITSQNNDDNFIGKPIFLNSVIFSGKKVPQTQKHIQTRKNKTLPMLSSLYEQVKLMAGSDNSEKHSKRKKNDIEAIEIIKCFDELSEFTSSLSSTDEVISAVNDHTVSFSEKWQRRSISIQKKTEELRNKIQQEMNETTHLVAEFQSDIKKDFEQLKNEVHDLESDLYFKVLEGYSLSKELGRTKKSVKKGGIPKFLMYTSLVEVVLMFVFMVLEIRQSRI